MKSYILAVFILGWPSLMSFASGAPSTSSRVGALRSYACYYGKGHEDELARYDLVIVQPDHYDANAVKRIKRHQTKVLGYLSIGETDLAPPELSKPASKPASAVSTDTFRRIPPFYVNRKGDGRPDRNGGWGSYFVDAAAPAWRTRVLDQLLPNIIQQRGMDGVFLDTVDTAEVYPETAAGMVGLIGAIRARHPRMPIFINRGFNVLDKLLATVDGIMFECYTSEYDPTTRRSHVLARQDLEWTDQTLKKIVEQGRSTGLVVLLLDYVDSKSATVREQAVARARKTGLLYSIANGVLDKLPVEGSGPARSR